MVKCWYCNVERTLGDGHMYICVNKQVRNDNINRAMVDALNADLEMVCPVEQCDTIFKGKFAEITVNSIIHYQKYHEVL